MIDTRWNAWVGGRVDLFDGDAAMDGGMATIVTGVGLPPDGRS
jgi:hypothetical protein